MLVRGVVLLAMLVVSNIVSAHNNYRFKHLGVEDGLSESSALCMIQDSYGYIWIGTKDGLNRYDGVDFKVFRSEANDSTSLGNDFVRAIYEINKSALLIGSEQGMFVYDRKKNQFSPIKNNPDVYVTDIDVLNDSIVLFASLSEGLFSYNIISQEVERYTTANSRLTENTIWDIQKYNDITLVATRRGVVAVEYSSEGLVINDDILPKLTNDEILCIYPDSYGKVWFGTWSTGFIFAESLNSPLIRKGDKLDEDAYITHVRSFAEYDNNILIGSDDGLYVWGGKNIQRIDKPNRADNITDQNVYSMIKDEDGGLWIGTYFGGVNYLSNRLLNIANFSPAASPKSIRGKAVSEIIEIENSNKFWVATEDAGIALFDEAKNEFTIPDFADELSYHNVHSLLRHNNHLWIGTFSRGIDVVSMDGKHNIINYRNTENNKILPDNCIFSMANYADSVVLVGTPFGLMYINTNDNTFTSEDRLNQFIYDIEVDGDIIWIATYGSGLFRLNMNDNSLKQYVRADYDQMPSDKLTFIRVDSKKRIWMGGEQGLCFLQNGKITNMSDMLPNDFIYTVIEDNYGYIWVTHNNGLTRIDLDACEVFNLNQYDGLQGSQFNYRSALNASNGKLLFGGVHGLNVIDPLKVYPNKNAPKTIVSRFVASNNDKSENRYEYDIRDSIHIELDYNINSISVNFSTFSYLSPENNRYKYRLTRTDDEQAWEEESSKGEALFYDLSPATYVFQVKGSNGDGVWSINSPKIVVVIHPPFWKNNLFKSIYVLILLIALVLMSYLYRGHVNKKQQQKNEMFEVLKEQELYNSKMEFYTNLAHEIRTPITLVKGPLNELEKSCVDQERKNIFKIVNRNVDRLTDLVEQLLTFRRIDEDKYPIVMQNVNITKLISDILAQFLIQLKKKNITLEVNFQESTITTQIDKEGFTKILSNLLTNAIKFTSSKIIIDVLVSENNVIIKVKDDGQGIDKSDIENIFNPFFQTSDRNKTNGLGLGLAIAKLLTDKLDGNIAVKSNPGGGTCFNVSFPIIESKAEAMNEAMSEEVDGRKFILIVDDNEDQLTYLRILLKTDYNVVTANDSRKVIEILKEGNIDLLVCDIMMPNVDGKTLITEIKKHIRFKSLPIVVVSAKCDPAFEAEMINLGVTSFVKKPFDAEVLKAIIVNSTRGENKTGEGENEAFVLFKKDINTQIEENVIDVSPDLLARLMNMSRSTLNRRVNEMFRMSTNEYIQFYKITKATEMIKTGKHKINEICYLLGFSSPSYFSKCFKKIIGVLPKDFLNKSD
ncbi:MAG: two-component regulator propeller domain-containing protein [Bacteroides xylanisolvens]